MAAHHHCDSVSGAVLDRHVDAAHPDGGELLRIVAMLRQDVEDNQAKLSNLEATLPDRAQKLNMVPASGSLTIDLNGYQPPKDEKATTGESAEQQATSNQHDTSQGGATE